MKKYSHLRFLLHVSDFHIRDETSDLVHPVAVCEKGEAPRSCSTSQITRAAFEAISTKLQNEHIKVDYLIHTGDVVDAGNVTAQTIAAYLIIYKDNLNIGIKSSVSVDRIIAAMSSIETKGKSDVETVQKIFDYLVEQQILDGRFVVSEQVLETAKSRIREDRFQIAEKLFPDILNILNIPAGNVLICCGNHDIVRKPKPVNLKCQSNGLADEIFESLGEESFKLFENFVTKLKTANCRNYGSSNPVASCTLGELNVLILNSNWPTPAAVASKNQHCINCTQVCDQITAYLNDGVYQKDNLNIVIAHKPLYEICEKARLSYKNYFKTQFMSKLHGFLGENGIYLCGDKHTRSVIGAAFHDIPHYMSGEPLYELDENGKNYEAEYNLLGVADGKVALEWKLHLWSKDGKKWVCDIRPQDATVSELYELSRSHISPITYKYISTDQRLNTWEDLSQVLFKDDIRIDYADDDNSLIHECSITADEYMDDMFKAMACYRENGKVDLEWSPETNDSSKDMKTSVQTVDAGSTQNLEKLRNNIFIRVTQRIVKKMSGTNRNILNLRGPHSTGKSSFLGLLYIYLLRLYSMGKIDFIPAYFALENESMLQKVQNSSTYYQAVKEEFAAFTADVQRIAKREGQKVCYLLDRIDTQDCWSFSSEDSVGRGLLDILSTCENAWHIFAYGDYRLPWFKKTMPPRVYSEDSDVMFFNPIEVYLIAPRNDQASYLEANEDPTLSPAFVSFVRAFLQKSGFFETAQSCYAKLIRSNQSSNNDPTSKPNEQSNFSTPKEQNSNAEPEGADSELKTTSNPTTLPKEVADELVDQVCRLILNFRRLEISPGFMRQNYDFLTTLEIREGKLRVKNAPETEQKSDLKGTRRKNATSFTQQVHSYYIDRQLERCLKRIGYEFVHYAPAMAYLFSRRRYTYEQFIKIKDDVKLRNQHPTDLIAANQDKIYNAFMFITKHQDSREYLVALHYHRELRYYTEHPDEKIPISAILNDHIPRPIAVLIRKGWSDTNKFIIVCDNLLRRDDLNCCAYSMLLYCLAHIRIYEPIRNELKERIFAKAYDLLSKELNIEKKHLQECVECNDCSDGKFNDIWTIKGVNQKRRLEYFLRLGLLHTMMICNAMEVGNSNNLLMNLKGNEHFRIYNRQHQLLYYQDVSINSDNIRRPLVPGEDTIHCGMDFGNTMNYLCVKLCSAMAPHGEKYALFEYDLYTLCDLIQSRCPSDQDAYKGNGASSFHGFGKYRRSIARYLALVLKQLSSAEACSSFVIKDLFPGLLDELEKLSKDQTDKKEDEENSLQNKSQK